KNIKYNGTLPTINVEQANRKPFLRKVVMGSLSFCIPILFIFLVTSAIFENKNDDSNVIYNNSSSQEEKAKNPESKILIPGLNKAQQEVSYYIALPDLELIPSDIVNQSDIKYQKQIMDDKNIVYFTDLFFGESDLGSFLQIMQLNEINEDM